MLRLRRVACFRRSFARTANPASARRKHAERQVAHPQPAYPSSLGSGSIAIGGWHAFAAPLQRQRTLHRHGESMRSARSLTCNQLTRPASAVGPSPSPGGMLSPLLCNDSKPCIGTAKACGAPGRSPATSLPVQPWQRVHRHRRVACFRRSFATTANPAPARRKHGKRQVAHPQPAYPSSPGSGSITIGTGLIPA